MAFIRWRTSYLWSSQSLLFLTAYEIAVAAVRGGMAPLSYRGWLLAAVAALVPVPFIFGRYQVHVGRQLNSPSLIADGVQHQADVLTSAVVMVAFLGQSSGLALDRVATVIIALFIIRSGWDILVSGMRVLLDASVDPETLDKIRSLILEEPAVSSLKEVTARNSGQYLFVEASLALRIRDLKGAHLASLHIEDKIRREVSQGRSRSHPLRTADQDCNAVCNSIGRSPGGYRAALRRIAILRPDGRRFTAKKPAEAGDCGQLL